MGNQMLRQDCVSMTTGRAFVTNDGNNVGDRMTMPGGYEVSFVGCVLLSVRMGTGTKRTGVVMDVKCQHSPKKNLMC